MTPINVQLYVYAVIMRRTTLALHMYMSLHDLPTPLPSQWLAGVGATHDARVLCSCMYVQYMYIISVDFKLSHLNTVYDMFDCKYTELFLIRI